MGRRKREMAQMGKALIKDRFRGRQTKRNQSDGFLHTTELNDGDEYAGNIMSVTDQNSLDDFLTTAELAGRDFTAQRENVQLVTAKTNSGVLSPEQLKKVKAVQEQHRNLLRIPRRPAWSESTTADKLQHDENLSFLEWRRQLGQLQENEHIHITPYEKNLEFWRQLWRVIERSDVVVQIVDARNPLLFYCEDMEEYVKEIDPLKQPMLLVNKADLLSENQRQAWAEYFTSKGIKAVFWSAAKEIERVEAEKAVEEEHLRSADGVNESDNDCAGEEVDEDELEAEVTVEENDHGSEDDKDENQTAAANSSDFAVLGEADDVKDKKAVIREDADVAQDLNGQSEDCRSAADRAGSGNRDRNSGTGDKGIVTDIKTEPEEEEYDSEDFETEEEYTDDEEDEGDEREPKAESHAGSGETKKKPVTEAAYLDQHNKDEVSSVLRRGEELLDLFRKAARKRHTEGVTTVGMVGYPNVGKSSTINAILKSKKVPVSATPGRTKHFQTLYVENDLMLCDCPGLVFPSFVNSKADLVVNGILPIDQLQDSDSPVALVCDRVGRETLQATYSINLPPPEQWEDPAKPPSAYQLLQAYGSLRGFMTHKGNVDRPRAARLILKDYVNGKLLFCHSPPGIDEKAFQKPPYVEPRVLVMPHHLRTLKTETEQKQEALDREFYAQSKCKAHYQGPHANKTEKQQSGASEKPWKRHHNRNKREKLRRVYADLDKH